jgi:hypothetical protein
MQPACLCPNNSLGLTSFDESKCLNCRRDRVVLNVLCEVKKDMIFEEEDEWEEGEDEEWEEEEW